jgi:hypothetical protein
MAVMYLSRKVLGVLQRTYIFLCFSFHLIQPKESYTDVTVGNSAFFLLSFSGSIRALYGPLIFHMLLATVHCMVANVFNGTIDLKPLCPG